MLYARPASTEDAHVLAPQLRQADVREIWAASGSSPLAALLQGIKLSDECYSIVTQSNDVIGMFGAGQSALPLVGIIWMLASDELPKHAKSFLRQSRPWVSRLHSRYPILTNYVDQRNTEHIRWLQWIGCKCLRLVPHFGFEQLPFYEFCHV